MVKQRQVGFGNTWEDVMTFAARLEETFGEKQGFADNARVEVIWRDPESRNETLHLQALETKKRLGVPDKQLWREMGYSQEKIDQMLEEKREQRSRDTDSGSSTWTG